MGWWSGLILLKLIYFLKRSCTVERIGTLAEATGPTIMAPNHVRCYPKEILNGLAEQK